MIKTIKRENFETVADVDAGFGILKSSKGNLPLCALSVRSKITGLATKTTLRQTFRNNQDVPIEATYIFPMPGRDAVTKFEMHIGDRVVDGVLKERGEARKEYAQAIKSGHQAAIAEEERSETFTMRAGNIPAGEEVTIELTLVSELPLVAEEAMFRFPLVVAPRFISGATTGGTPAGDGVALDTDQVPDASRVTPPVLLPGFPNPVDLSVEVEIDTSSIEDPKTWLDGMRCSLHAVVVEQGTDSLKIRLNPGERLNRDFILRFAVLNSNQCQNVLRATQSAQEESDVFALTLTPPASSTFESPPRDVVFVIDQSGSMGGWKIVAARRAVARMIDSMRDQDRFTAISFESSVHYSPLGPKFIAATDRNRWQMVQWASKIQSDGGTNIERAVIAALSTFEEKGATISNEPSHQRNPVVVLITDGQIGAEDATLKAIKQTKQGATPVKFFTLGIDRAVNHGFLTRVADMTGGLCETVETEDQLDRVMDRFHREIGSPIVTDIKVTTSGGALSEVTPNRLLNLFPGRPLTIMGKIKGAEKEFNVTVTGTLPDGKPWKRTTSAIPGDGETLKALWGRKRVRDLEDQYASGNATKQLESQIVAASLEANVLCRFTSYVAVDRSRVVNDGAQPQKVVQAVETPEGWADHSTPASAKAGRARMVKKKRASSFGIENAFLSDMCPEAVARENGIIPIGTQADGTIEFAAADPNDLDLQEKLRFILNRDVVLQQGESDQIQQEINQQYGQIEGESADSILQEFTDTAIDFTESVDEDGDQFAEDAPIIRLVNLMITEAHQLGCNAFVIHVDDPAVAVKYVIDNQLHERDRLPIRLLSKIRDRICSLASIDASNQSPSMGTVTHNQGDWTACTFYQADGNPMILMTLATAENSLQQGDGTTTEVVELLNCYLWLPAILEAMLQVTKSDSDGQRKLAKWMSFLTELTGKLPLEQRQAVLELGKACREAALNSANVINLDEVVGSTSQLDSKSEKVFWK